MPQGARLHRQRTKHDLRCFCSRKPLLGVYGIDEKGRLYVHTRVYKQGRVFGEAVYYGGTVNLLCRECLRWNEVVILDSTRATLAPIEEPEAIRSKVGSGESLPDDQPHS